MKESHDNLGAWYMVSRVSFMAWHIVFHIELACYVGMCFRDREKGIAYALRWGLVLVGGILYLALLTPSWDPLSIIRSIPRDGASTRP